MSKKWILLIGLLAVGLVIVGIEAAAFGLSRDTASDEASRVATRPLSGTADAVPTGVEAAAAGPGQGTAILPAPAAAGAPAPGLHGANGAEPQGAPTLSQAADTAVQPDPDYENALTRARISTRGWKTDFSRHTVPYNEILSGGPPRDGIPPIDNPSFVSLEDAESWLGDLEPVVAFELNDEAKAYPLQVLTWHEIVNDTVGGEPVVITFCPLCNSALAFDRRLNGVVHDFGTSGKLRHSDLIMWDRQTETWWQQFTGDGIVGELAGQRLRFLPAAIVSFADFQASHPEGTVLSRDTGFGRDYGRNPYAGYDRADKSPFLFSGSVDGRLLPMERVASVTIGGVDAAFPYSVLKEERAVNYPLNGSDLAVFFKLGTASALDGLSIKGSRDVGATGVFDPHVDGQKLTFRAQGDGFVDDETGSTWNILGKAVDGPLSGKELTAIVHGDHFWFSWGAFKPDTLIYQGMG